MYIKKLEIFNYKLFKDSFNIDFNIPDGTNIGSGLTILCGENGVGKSSILEAIGLAVHDYRGENFTVENINDLRKSTTIKLETDSQFEVKRVLPQGTFNASGFLFQANVRKRTSGDLYGSLVVHGRKIIPISNEKDYELRCEGTTPWGSPRFTFPSLVYLDRNRIFQARKGSSTSTNFDYLLERLSLEDFSSDLENSHYQLKDEHPLNKTFTKFQEKFNIPLNLFQLNPVNPLENGFIASKTDKNIIRLNNLGSGYEMVFSILWALERTQESNKDLIVLLDEPELHLHPKLQEDLIEFLLKISKNVQIIIATHSPLFIKQLKNEKTQFHVLQMENGFPTLQGIKEQKIKSFLSLNEVNFIAFNLYTEEYFNELYETLYKQKLAVTLGLKIDDFDHDFFVSKHSLAANKPNRATNSSKNVTIITFIRNVIHHKIDYQSVGLNFTKLELEVAVNKMRELLL